MRLIKKIYIAPIYKANETNRIEKLDHHNFCFLSILSRREFLIMPKNQSNRTLYRYILF